MRHIVGVAIAIGVAGAGCRPRATAPDSLVVFYGPGVPDEGIGLEWIPPSAGDLTGYRVEWRAAGGTYQVLGDVPAKAWQAFFTARPEMPELTDIEVRLRALPDPGGNRTASGFFHRKPFMPLLECVGARGTSCPAGPEGFTFLIRNRSPGATALVIERSKVLPETTAVIPGPSFELPPDSTSFSDPLTGDWSEEATYEYSLFAVKGGERSIARTLTTEALPLLAPESLTATPVTAGTQLSFVSRSERATCYEISVAAPPGGGLVLEPCLAPPAPGSSATFVDTTATGPPPSFRRYNVVAKRSWRASSFPATVAIVPSAPVGFSMALVQVPGGSAAVRLASGAFATADWRYGATPVVYGPGTPPAALLLYYSASFAYPPLVVDPGDAVHAFYHQRLATFARLARARFDGVGWSEDEIALADRVEFVAPGLGLDGVLRVAWRSGSNLSVATRNAASWTVERVPGTVSTGTQLAVDADPGGATHIVHEDGTGGLIHRSKDGGTWQSELIPGSWDARYGLHLYAGPGTLRLVARVLWGGWVLAERSVAGWAATEPLDSVAAAARSADGSTVVVAAASSLWIRGPAGTRVLPRPASGATVVATGIAAGKGWILEHLWPTGLPDGSWTAVLYEEL